MAAGECLDMITWIQKQDTHLLVSRPTDLNDYEYYFFIFFGVEWGGGGGLGYRWDLMTKRLASNLMLTFFLSFFFNQL